MTLDEILAHKRAEVATAEAAQPDWEQRAPPRRARRDFAAALRGEGLRVIAEFKRKSPAAGVLNHGAQPADYARRYAQAGASALSVLTDQRFFDGSLADAKAAAAASALPVLRKDFILRPFQVWESACAPVDAILLIVAALDQVEVRALLDLASQFDIQALVEVHNEAEVDRALEARAPVIGINNRDLETFRVDLAVTRRLRPRIPPDRVVVSESGIHTRADVQALADTGVDAILVGEALMTAPDPHAKLAELLGGNA